MTNDHLQRPVPEQIEDRPHAAAARLLLGGPVVLVTTTWRGRTNVMPLAWHMPVSVDPPMVAIAVEQSRHTAEMIRHSQEFALNFPTRPLLHHVQYLGSLRGDRVDKIEAAQLETFPPEQITAPLLSACAAWVECSVVEVMPLGDHVLFVALVNAVRVNPASFDDAWIVGPEETRPLHFLGGNRYSFLSRIVEARMPQHAEAPERILRERLAEELELTRDARERREERLDALKREVEEGRALDLTGLEIEVSPESLLDLSRGHVIGEPPRE
ncbi:MAG: flavin reductase family protein [Dehalococcoidia bacterium]